MWEGRFLDFQAKLQQTQRDEIAKKSDEEHEAAVRKQQEEQYARMFNKGQRRMRQVAAKMLSTKLLLAVQAKTCICDEMMMIKMMMMFGVWMGQDLGLR